MVVQKSAPVTFRNEIDGIQAQKKKVFFGNYTSRINDGAQIKPELQNSPQLSKNNSAEYIIKDENLYKDFIETQRLPAKEISENLKINRKQLDRGRKYIISLIVLKKGNYEMLSEYIRRG